MIMLFTYAVLILTPIIWIYFKFSPSNIKFRDRVIFEVSVLSLLIIGCVIASYYSYFTVGQGVDGAWWPVEAFLYCVVIIPVIIIVAFIIRNLLYRAK